MIMVRLVGLEPTRVQVLNLAAVPIRIIYRRIVLHFKLVSETGLEPIYDARSGRPLYQFAYPEIFGGLPGNRTLVCRALAIPDNAQ
jgi:hypothetical protein